VGFWWGGVVVKIVFGAHKDVSWGAALGIRH
jgi:hypothetical protein